MTPPLDPDPSDFPDLEPTEQELKRAKLRVKDDLPPELYAEALNLQLQLVIDGAPPETMEEAKLAADRTDR